MRAFPSIEARVLRGGADGGWFELLSPLDGAPLRIIASDGMGWDHVSVSRADRCPTWEEMDFVKRCFFHADETAVQLHVPDALHINQHPNCLHLWRPHAVKIPLPPRLLV